MKKLLSLLATALLLTSASPARAVEKFFKVSVTGTVQTQTLVSANDGRIHTTTLNNKRIFQEFAVSQDDYALVFGTTSGLVLLPKLSSSGLPTLTILQFGPSSAEIIDTHAKFIKLQTDITAGSNTNLFKNLAGEIGGSAFFKGPFADADFIKLVFSVNANGTDTSGGNGQALLKFKITSGGVFVQQ